MCLSQKGLVSESSSKIHVDRPFQTSKTSVLLSKMLHELSQSQLLIFLLILVEGLTFIEFRILILNFFLSLLDKQNFSNQFGNNALTNNPKEYVQISLCFNVMSHS